MALLIGETMSYRTSGKKWAPMASAYPTHYRSFGLSKGSRASVIFFHLGNFRHSGNLGTTIISLVIVRPSLRLSFDVRSLALHPLSATLTCGFKLLTDQHLPLQVIFSRAPPESSPILTVKSLPGNGLQD